MSEPHVDHDIVERVVSANPSQFAQADTFKAMEYLLQRLDNTYALCTEDHVEATPEEMHTRRVEIMLGVIKTALQAGFDQGIAQSIGNMEKVMRGEHYGDQ